MSGAAGRGAAAAALIVTLGSTAPAFAAPWAGPSLHGGESAGSTSGTDSARAVEHHTASGHTVHESSHPTSGDESHDSHDAGTGADDAHQEYDGNASGHDGHDPSAGADAAHGEHEGDASGHDDHDAAASDASAGADDGHDDHDGDASSGHGDASSEHSDDGGHGSEADTVSDATKTRVLGGFGVVNAAAVGGAFLLRRRDRKSTTKPGRVRGSRRDRTRRTR